MTSGVYEIVNTVTGSRYVGSAVDIDGRWRAHKHTLRSRGKSPPKLQRAWDKHGEAAFACRVLVVCSRENTLLYEQLAIDALQPKYNTRLEAKSNLGIRWSAATNAKKTAHHRVHEVRGVVDSIAGHARRFGVVSPRVAAIRVKRDGYSVERAVTEPPMSHKERGARPKPTGLNSARGKPLTFRGKTGTIGELVKAFGVVSLYATKDRLQRGWSLERALLTPKQR